MATFQYKPVDQVGEDTLEVIAQANQFNYWMYETIKPFCQGNILEIGSGIGNISKYFIDDGSNIFLTDIRQGYCDSLKTLFGNKRNVLGIESIDLVDPNFDDKYKDHLNQYNSVFALNVVEHIQDDQLAITNAKKLLRPKGTLVILVPSYQFLYNEFDIGLEHYRRYNLTSLQKLINTQKLEIIHKQYFNFIGIFGWFVSGSILKKKQIPSGQMKLYNSLVPVFKIIDKAVFQSMGLSTIVVGQKES